MQIQYVGFQLRERGREYLYRVLDPRQKPREFGFTILNQAFTVKRVPYQDAADLCYKKLQRALAGDGTEPPRHSVVSDQDLEEYLQSQRPTKRRHA
ncbi:MAG TPA: hypothetical protein VMT20_24795 [Terriglobia bacterium]|nr:hypothetical protein [Terriglobia bacterium]